MTRKSIAVGLTLAFTTLVSQAQQFVVTVPGLEYTTWPRYESAVILGARANDPLRSQAERACAVFTLFSRYIHPPASEAETLGVLAGAFWLDSSRLDGIHTLGGKVPVEMNSEDTVFVLRLFPGSQNYDEKFPNWSSWNIYFRLSGQLKDEEAARFLRGEYGMQATRLLEFALAFPAIRGDMGRVERLTSNGMMVFDDKGGSTCNPGSNR